MSSESIVRESIVRYRSAGGIRVGLLGADGVLRELACDSIAELLAAPLAEARRVASDPGAVVAEYELLAPIDGATELWASGVTYLRSRDARTEESGNPSIYELVYDAERPELFFKAVAWRVVGAGAPIGIRADATLSVPEPELAVVVNAAGEIFGYTACNDVSSRDLEGENPLYLPQAKVYAGSAALGPGIVPAWDLPADPAFAIAVRIERDGTLLWEGATSTAQMKRGLADLVDWAGRGDHFPQGFVLSTGTGAVPGMDLGLAAGDVVTISIEGVGDLANTVAVGTEAFGHLWERNRSASGATSEGARTA